MTMMNLMMTIFLKTKKQIESKNDCMDAWLHGIKL